MLWTVAALYEKISLTEVKTTPQKYDQTTTQQEETNTDVQDALITHSLAVRPDEENIIILNTRSSTTNALVSSL